MLPFLLPPPEGFSTNPQWNGRNFLIDDSSFSILEYSENFSGWSDDLTSLHEEAVGDNHPIDIASRADALAQVKKINPDRNTIIMEIGCSSGFLIRDLAKEFPSSIIIGVDVVKEPLHRLAKSLPSIPLMRFDLLKCPLPNSSVDALIMLNVFEHIEDDVEAIKKAFNLIKPGGKLIVEVPSGPSLYDSYDKQLQHFRRYSLGELKEKLEFAGFKVIRTSYLGAILFPAFAAVKYFNKFFPKDDIATVVKDSASKTKSSALVNWAMLLESKYLSNRKLPFGIRVLITAEKLN
jgi:SAM-dependent methyltransferase